MKILLLLVASLTVGLGSIYELKMKSIDGNEIDFAQYKGKTLLIVNTASKCGYTPQYKELQQLHEQYGKKLIILGFPANNFGSQEPGSNLEISGFCEKNYGVTFQMFEKVSVKGDDQCQLYQYLKEKTGSDPNWNFCKYLVKSDGSVQFFPSRVSPMDAKIISEL